MNKTFAENIDIIRNAKRGVEVREGMAESLEYVKEFAEDMPQQVKTATDSAAIAKKAQDASALNAEKALSCEQGSERNAEAAEKSMNAAKVSEEAAQNSADRAAAVVSTDKTLSFAGAPADAATVGVRLKLLEISMGISVEGNAFVTKFDTLDGITLDGAWNKAEKRIEF